TLGARCEIGADERSRAVLDNGRDYPSVYVDHRPRYEAGARTGKKCDDGCHLLRIAGAANGSSGYAGTQHFVDWSMFSFRAHFSEVDRALRVEVAREHGVHGDVVLRALIRQRLGKAQQSRASRVGEKQSIIWHL